MIIPLYSLVYLVASYFNKGYTYNDFNRVTCHISFIAIILFFLSEARLAIGKNSYAFHFVMSLICIICISAYILPLLFLSAFWEMSFSASLVFELSEIAVLIYAIYSASYALYSLKEREI
ncbi:MAG: hypothetical protein ACI4QR_03285 [Eubacteriales bacterium]